MPSVGLRQRTVPLSLQPWDEVSQASEAGLPTGGSNLVIPGVSEVEQRSPRGVRIQHASTYVPIPGRWGTPIPTLTQ